MKENVQKIQKDWRSLRKSKMKFRNIYKNKNNDFMDSMRNRESEGQKSEKLIKLEYVKIRGIFSILKIIFGHQNEYSAIYKL